jgi:hypothetical protein
MADLADGERLAAIADAGMPPTPLITVDVHTRKRNPKSAVPYPVALLADDSRVPQFLSVKARARAIEAERAAAGREDFRQRKLQERAELQAQYQQLAEAENAAREVAAARQRLERDMVGRFHDTATSLATHYRVHGDFQVRVCAFRILPADARGRQAVIVLDSVTDGLFCADDYTRVVLLKTNKNGLRAATEGGRAGTIHFEPSGKSFLTYTVFGTKRYKGTDYAQVDKTSLRCTASSLPSLAEELAEARRRIDKAAAAVQAFETDNPIVAAAGLPVVSKPPSVAKCRNLENLDEGSDHVVVALTPTQWRGQTRYIFEVKGKGVFVSNAHFVAAFEQNGTLAHRPFSMRVVGPKTTKTNKKRMDVYLA